LLLKSKKKKDDEVTWSTDTSKEAVERRRREILGDASNEVSKLVQDLNVSVSSTNQHPEQQQQQQQQQPQPQQLQPQQVPPKNNNNDGVKELTTFIQSDPKPSPKDVAIKAKEFKERYKWNDRMLIQTIFYAIFDKNIMDQFKNKVKYLQPFVKGDTQQQVVLFLS